MIANVALTVSDRTLVIDVFAVLPPVVYLSAKGVRTTVPATAAENLAVPSTRWFTPGAPVSLQARQSLPNPSPAPGMAAPVLYNCTGGGPADNPAAQEPGETSVKYVVNADVSSARYFSVYQED